MKTLRGLARTAVTLLVATGAGLEAQVAGGQTQALSECLLPPIQGAADLIPCGLGFNALGEITFVVKNRGSAGVNTSRTARVADSDKKVRLDLYLDDRLIQSLYHATFQGSESREFTAKIPSNYPTPKCGETRGLKLVIDPQNQFPESSESNNTGSRTTDRPCPDMEVSSISANFNDLRTEFVAEIRIANKGNARARFRYMALTSNSSAFGPLPAADFDKWMEIEPGQSKKFTIGNSFSNGKMYVRVFLDRFSEIAELNEGNNFKEKTLP